MTTTTQSSSTPGTSTPGTSTHTPAPRTVTPEAPGTAGLGSTLRFELLKLLTSWRTRGLLLICLAVPGLFIAAVSTQSTLPSDTVFGRWMLASGWADSLVVLAFSCTWVLPLLTAVIAGDVFSVEDRLGTWRHLMMAVRSPLRIFATKVIASVVVIVLLVACIAASSLAGGLLAVGNRPMVGLDGQTIGAGHAAALVGIAWAYAAVAALGFAGVGLFGSIAMGRNPMGLLLPALLAFLLDLCQMLPLPVPVRMALPSQPFVAWRGLFSATPQIGPLLTGLVVSLTWAVLATAMAWLLFRRRDFTDLVYDGSIRRCLLAGVLPLALLVGLTAGVLAGTGQTGSGITRPKVETAVSTTFGHLYRLQTAQLNRPDVTEAQMAPSAACDKGGSLVTDESPGTDWRCVVSWHLPGAKAFGRAIYQVDVMADGRIVADGDGPTDVNGYFVVKAPYGTAPNPLWQVDSLIDLTSHK